MQYLVLIPRAVDALPTSLSKEEVELEAEFVRQLYADGTVRQIWLRAEGGACMITEAQDAGRLRRSLSDLPLVKSGYLAQPQISQLRPYTGFGPRLATANEQKRMAGSESTSMASLPDRRSPQR